MAKPLQSQSGAIAIFMVAILSILLLVTTTFAARLQVSELNQSSNIDRSEQAYYAAEAGIEEAIRRLDRNPNAPLEGVGGLFPCNGSGGDQADLSDASVILDTPCQTSASELGTLAWRSRTVGRNSILKGVQVKDETAQFDASSLNRKCAGGGTAGVTNDRDCDGSSIYGNFRGLEFSWSAANSASGGGQIELTVVSWPQNNLGSITTQKILPVAGTACSGGYTSCFTYPSSGSLDSGRRYIFRAKLLFPSAGRANCGDGTHNCLAVNYSARLLDSTNNVNPLYMPNDAVLIDVIGQSGDIRRRIIAKKLRNGRLLGIFDYVLYSGDPAYPLCKPGVHQEPRGGYSSDCIAIPEIN